MTQAFYGKTFLFVVSVPVHLLGRALLSELKGLIHFASNGDFTLEFPDQPEPGLLCSSQSAFDIEEKEFQQKSLI